MSSNNRISNIVASQLPFFVRSDHQTFVRFLEAYYEYLEQNTKLIHRSKNARNYRDVDLTIDDFSIKLYNEFLKYIPEDVIVDKNLILKHIKDFYRAKGSEKATRFLMRIMYGTEIDIYYPKKDILRVSDGKWFVQKSLRITNTSIDGVSNTNLSGLEKYIGTQVTGNNSGTTALVERIDRFYDQGTQIDELILSNLDGDFSSGEVVHASFIDGSSVRGIQSNTFGGIVNSIQIINGGAGYMVGDPVIIVSNTGVGACATVASVTIGNITSIFVSSGGAGYRVGANVTFSGGDGSGAVAAVNQVLLDNSIHPNSYNIVSSTISLEANTPLNNAIYSNLNAATVNTTIANAVNYWSYSNTGPILTVLLSSTGNNYTSVPTVTAEANSMIYALGILGRMQIINGGQNYQIGDTIEIINNYGGYGSGAVANVTNVNQGAANAISAVRFYPMTGFLPGGSGYDQLILPRANVISSTGNGANIIIKSILGAGANLIATTGTIGTIERIIITNRGRGYTSNATIDLTQSGNANATANISIVEGVYSYPGRYLNDDGHISSFNFIQDRDYYQNFSYVIRSNKSIANYRKAIKDTVHPAGTKLFSEYLYLDESSIATPVYSNTSTKALSKTKTYVKTGNTINVLYSGHNLSTNTNIYLEFLSGDLSNVRNGSYNVTSTSANTYFEVIQKSNLRSITITNGGRLYNSNSYLVITGGGGNGANVGYTVNSNGSIVSVNIYNRGINFTSPPIITALGSNSIAASFTSTINHSNNTTGNVEVIIIRQ